MITFFKTLYDKKPHYTNPEKIFRAIRDGGKDKDLIEKIRKEKDKEKRDILKKQLGVVLFSGQFSERNIKSLKEYSKLICLDFDDVDPSFKIELCEDAHAWAVFRSPSGNGFKALFKVSSDDHAGHIKALFSEYPDADKSTKDVSRATFMSYDPEIYVNPNPDVYTKVIKDAFTEDQKYDNLKKWLENKGEKFVSGNRNNFLTKLAGAMNRFGLEREFAKEVILRDYVQNSDFRKEEAVSVVDKIYTNYLDKFATQSFENAITEAQTNDILSTELVLRDIITLVDVKGDLYEDYDVGIKGGETTYFPALDENFKMMRGEVSVLTGHSGMGKSTFLNQLLLIKSVKEGKKWGFLSLEQYPPVYFFRELIRTYIGKPIERERADRMTRKEYETAMEFLKEHFFYVYPEKDDPTPEYTHARFLELVIKYGIDGVVTDPYNSQSHDYNSAGGRDDRYIAQMLNKEQRFALQNNLYDFIVAHPKNIGKNDDGTFKKPTADSISGGVTWWQRSDNVLVFHRPFIPLDYRDPTCTFGSLKIKKQPLNGRPGEQTFSFDYWKGRYYLNNHNPL